MNSEHGEGPSTQKEVDDYHPHQEHGGEEWLISYADLMTLLVGFFVILLSFSKVDEEKFEEARKSVNKEFGGKYEKPNEDMGNRIKEALEKVQSAGQVIVKVTNTGVEISFVGPVFFTAGSADVKKEAEVLLDTLLPTLKKESEGFDVVVEGHTDDTPLAPGGFFKNNFELSSIRACRVLEYLFNFDFAREHLTAIGYGETRPHLPNRDKNGTPILQNQSQNRRVVIKLIKRGNDSL